MTTAAKDPEIRRRLATVARLKKKDDDVTVRLAHLRADIGLEFRAIRDRIHAEFAKLKGWQKWIKSHTGYQVPTVNNYVGLANLRRILENRFSDFARRHNCKKLYRVAVLPEEILATLTVDTKLFIPLTGETKPIGEMSYAELDSALDRLQGRTGVPVKPPADEPCHEWIEQLARAKTKDEFALAARAIFDELDDRLEAIHRLPGTLDPAQKTAVIDQINSGEQVVNRWPAFATGTPKRKGKIGGP